MRHPLQEAVTIGDIVEAKNGHEQAGQSEPCKLDRVVEVGEPPLDGSSSCSSILLLLITAAGTL